MRCKLIAMRTSTENGRRTSQMPPARANTVRLHGCAAMEASEHP